MFFLTPPHVKQGRQFLKDARKLLAYKRDLVDQETVMAVEREIGHLEVALKMEDEAGIDAQMHRVDEVCGKLTKPLPDAVWRENVEVFLVAIVIALAVRTFFLQPFTIPTGSMQPTLNGIIGHKTTTPSPNVIVQVLHMALLGRTYVDVIAKSNESIVSKEEVTRFRFFTYTKLESSANNVYYVHAPLVTVERELLAPLGTQYRPGDPILRGYVDTGDHVFADKVSYNFRAPKRGEVFIFSTAGIEGISAATSQYYIKRLAGLPGDTLRIAAPKLFVNGAEPSNAAFQRVMAGTLTHPVDGYHGYSNPGGFPFHFLLTPDDTFSLEPQNYFALGDNSYNSSDSRAWGTVPEKNIMGRGLFVYWPFTSHWGWIH